MPTLHVRRVLDALYHKLNELAHQQQRSLGAQVIVMLDQALKLDIQRQKQDDLLMSVRQRRFVPPPDAPDPVELLRSDRER